MKWFLKMLANEPSLIMWLSISIYQLYLNKLAYGCLCLIISTFIISDYVKDGINEQYKKYLEDQVDYWHKKYQDERSKRSIKEIINCKN